MRLDRFEELIAAIGNYINHRNEHSKAFIWTARH
jgi:hypothetical protein